MTQSAFDRLYQPVGDSDRLLAAYDTILNDLFQNPLWESGSTELRRILWSQGCVARTEDNVAFRSSGLYLWGIEDRPLYIGITRGAFSKRFSRYIWSARSQCELAQRYKTTLVSDGINGFPVEIREWYARSFSGSKVRLLGAVRFAEEGIDSIWFALFPHVKLAEIRVLERALIPVAVRWNNDHGLRPLINIQE